MSNIKLLPRALRPNLPSGPQASLAQIISANEGQRLVDALRKRAREVKASKVPWALQEGATLHVLADLAALGWRVKHSRGTIYMVPRPLESLPPEISKQIIRNSLLEARDQQLRDPGTRAFLQRMHDPRDFNGRKVSISALIEDGARLAQDLCNCEGDLGKVVQPYLQLADADGRCPHTGLALGDIWRYFRHTWSLVYRPTPGRTLNFLIRNAARPDHPVMGIIGLANAVFQLAVRDSWIGWTFEEFLNRASEDATFWKEFRERALLCLESVLETTRSDDLLRDVGRRCGPRIASERLAAIAEEQAGHRKAKLKKVFSDVSGEAAVSARSIPRLSNGEPDWKQLSETSLFKRKRAELLSDVIFAIDVIKDKAALLEDIQSLRLAPRAAGRPSPKIGEVLVDRDIERALRVAVREIRKNGVSTRILDVNVCGASPSYRELLGGKLAAMALFSKEIQDAYVARYGSSASQIASAMAGKPVIKANHVCVLTTTSLYGGGSSQYNRVRLDINGRTVKWQEIGETQGFGTLHISNETIEAVKQFSFAKAGMRNVNNQFGEGSSPLLRQLREGLEMLGFQSDDVLKHAHRRIVYGAELYPEARRDLMLDRDTYTMNPSMAEISELWGRRWLDMRMRNGQVLKSLYRYSVESIRAELEVKEVDDASSRGDRTV